jgi:predicted ATPase
VKAPNIDRPAPLAIELAAARVRAASNQSIRERLVERLPLLTSRDRDVDERQRTLKATIASSYDLLDPDEQRATHSATVGRTTPAPIRP